MTTPTTKEDSYFNELHRKAVLLRSMIEVVFERITNRHDVPRDWVVDNMIDAARELSDEISDMVLEDPKHWAKKGGEA